MSETAGRFNALLNTFVEETKGVSDAVAVSSDGLLLARSETLDDAGADQVAAIISGFVSLGQGAVRCFAFDVLNQVIVAMRGGYLFVSALSDDARAAGTGGAACLGIVATAGGDIGEVGYQMALLVERCAEMLDAELMIELKAQVLVR